MSTNAVNLDALIPRDDFGGDAKNAGGQPRTAIAISDLDDGFFSNYLRKPDFQRETAYWAPQKVVELVEAFLDGDLIPAVILWQRGSEIFVIDGAHRLSALIAWIKDDYGDKLTSLEYFGSSVPDEQQKIADRTRTLIKKSVGTYDQFQAAKANKDSVSPTMQKRLGQLASGSIQVQWVSAADAAAAEASFFKINQAAQPIDPTEQRILQSRQSPNAIAARCIVRGGSGHKYWAKFPEDAQTRIESLGAEIYKALYAPPLGDSPIKTLDVPVAGRGYNTLPFIFDLVNLANDIPLPAKATTKTVGAPLGADINGTITVQFLENTKKRIQRIAGTHPSSLGLHPVIYFYGRSGQFQPLSFLAAIQFVAELEKGQKLKAFTKVRADFEQYIFDNKTFISLTSNRLGSGARSLSRIVELYDRVMNGFAQGRSADEITNGLFQDPDFAHLQIVKAPSPRANLKGANRKFSTATKSAAFFRDAIEGVTKCAICGAAVHRNSMTFDHVTNRRDGGTGQVENASIAHPYCNSTIKN
jgi:uncharacterized protein DUF262/HNH endonuclease